MAVGFKVKFYWYQVGTGDFLHSFFSTIAVNLEEKKWGSKYPFIMNKLYQNGLTYEEVGMALQELDAIKSELCHFLPDKVVWDINDLSKCPPWGDNISSDITDLSNYFVTSGGNDLIAVLREALLKALSVKSGIEIKSI